MLLKRLFTSNTRVKLLQYFFNHPDEEHFIRELTRLLNEQINSIRRELDNLHKLGLLQIKSRNRKKYYRLDVGFLFYKELKAIFTKANSNSDSLVKNLQQIGRVKLVVLTGLFVDKPSATDLLIVGDIDREAITRLLEAEVETEQPVRFSLLTAEDFIYRVKCNDKFIIDIIADGENVVAFNTFDVSLFQKVKR